MRRRQREQSSTCTLHNERHSEGESDERASEWSASRNWSADRGRASRGDAIAAPLQTGRWNNGVGFGFVGRLRRPARSEPQRARVNARANNSRTSRHLRPLELRARAELCIGIRIGCRLTTSGCRWRAFYWCAHEACGGARERGLATASKERGARWRLGGSRRERDAHRSSAIDRLASPRLARLGPSPPSPSLSLSPSPSPSPSPALSGRSALSYANSNSHSHSYATTGCKVHT